MWGRLAVNEHNISFGGNENVLEHVVMVVTTL